MPWPNDFIFWLWWVHVLRTVLINPQNSILFNPHNNLMREVIKIIFLTWEKLRVSVQETKWNLNLNLYDVNFVWTPKSMFLTLNSSIWLSLFSHRADLWVPLIHPISEAFTRSGTVHPCFLKWRGISLTRKMLPSTSHAPVQAWVPGDRRWIRRWVSQSSEGPHKRDMKECKQHAME